jgi:glycosyltransferase involved in cell wall biosynthesis
MPWELNTYSQQHSRLLITSEDHYQISDSGAIVVDGPANYAFWSRYLKVFDEVRVLARVNTASAKKGVQQRADGTGVTFYPLPDHTGPWLYLRARRKAQLIARAAIAECDAYLLRVPGLVSQLLWHEITRQKKPYAVEVVGDPWDAFSPGSWPSIFRPIFRIAATLQMKSICAGAMAASYVTSGALQRRYPPSKFAFTVGLSDAQIGERFASENVLTERRHRTLTMPWRDPTNVHPFRIGFVGSFSRLYKGPDVLLAAAALCVNRLDFRLAMAGEGSFLAQMKTLASDLGIANRVHFLGQLPSGKSIDDFLDSIDLFVMPSRAEGLPRALLEAMSRACPCIASAIGGIPELLDTQDLVPARNPTLLSGLILQVAADSDRLLAMSARNLTKAQQFSSGNINESRRTFLEKVKQQRLAQ